jgi:hypothetical protein
MAERILSTPSIVVNNENIKIKPNSFIYTEGFGEYVKRTESAGGGSVSTVSARNLETAKSMIKFTLEPLAVNADKIREWKNNFDNNVIQATGIDGFTRSFTSAIMTTDPEIGLSADGEIPLEWESDPAS